MLIDIKIALMKIMDAVMDTKSMPKLNFSLSFATRSENSPTDIMARLEKKGCSSLKFASSMVKEPIAINLDTSTASINAAISGILEFTAPKSIMVPIEMKNIEVNMRAYGWIARPKSLALGRDAIMLPA